ncbi:hypothetical protein PT2222_10424 [Paraburkholderia tropica]
MPPLPGPLAHEPAPRAPVRTEDVRMRVAEIYTRFGRMDTCDQKDRPHMRVRKGRHAARLLPASADGVV